MTSPSKRNQLRHFADLDDLFDSNDNEAILAWVNQLVDKVTTQREQGKTYRQRQQAFVRIAKEHLDEGEINAIKEQIAARVVK